ncbi:glycine cleavage system protein GcvH [Candidatus Aerophobetes bacterium]|uniref:Glycine cleavage system H protein n=1 Tax=Aerophobetes bacterium TaxID=2030807 RepID=A0A523TFH7_UNCAE|nr:MAG: glycine cleavage system protein GcvH [Candidatus Aerophobetes bacterium]
MAKVEEYDMPDELYYHKEFMWVRVEGEEAVVGLNDFSQKLAGEISYIEMPEEGDEVKQDEAIGSYETGKWLGKLYAPVSGEVTAMNEEVEDEPTLVNKDPYGEGWLFKIKMGDPAQLDNLMKGEEAIEWLKGEIAKHAKEKK